MVAGKPACQIISCRESAIIALESQDLCLEHFFDFCYRRLDSLERIIRNKPLERSESPAARVFLEECSNRALLVSLHHEHLTNLDRSRLLSILLLAADLRHALPHPLVERPDSRLFHPTVLFSKVLHQK
jgi:hypothetical protein